MIGYGHSTPVTIGGKAFCMGYAMVSFTSEIFTAYIPHLIAIVLFSNRLAFLWVL